MGLYGKSSTSCCENNREGKRENAVSEYSRVETNLEIASFSWVCECR